MQKKGVDPFAARNGPYGQRAMGYLQSIMSQWKSLTRRPGIVPYSLLFLAWLCLRLQPILASEPFATPDTLGYQQVANSPLGSINFFIGIRPFSVPLLHLIARTDTEIVAYQALLGLCCWGFLAITAARVIRHRWLRFLTSAAILCFSASEPIARWDFLLMSESVSLSLLALFVACWLTLLTEWRWWKVLLLLTVALFWGFTRDTNAYVLAMCGALLIPPTFLRRLRPHYLGIAAALLVLFLAVNMTAELSSRWVFPYLNVITTRILPDTTLTTAMAQQGMPVSPDLLRFTGKRAYGENYGLYTDPALAGFRDWLFEDGKQSYMRFLLTHPQWAFAEPFRDRDTILGLIREDDGFPHSTSRSQKWVGAIIYANRPGIFLGGFCIAILLAAYALGRSTSIGLAAWWVPLGLLLFAWPLGMIAWHGDSMDIGRHAMQAGVQARLGILLLALFAVDRLATIELARRSIRA